MNIVEGIFKRYVKFSNYAAVEICVQDAPRTSVLFDCKGDGWIAQGYIEYATANEYQDWKSGAELGARAALALLSREAQISVRQIKGMTTDTNPTVVAAAAANAVWKAFDIQPSDELVRHIESVVLDSWNQPNEYLPSVPEFLGNGNLASS